MALSREEVATLAYRAGFRGQALTEAVAIAQAESGLVPDVYNGSCCTGLWQIHRVNMPMEDAKDPAKNAAKAFEMWQRSGWRPWEVYTTGAYRKYMTDAAAAVATQEAGGWPLVIGAVAVGSALASGSAGKVVEGLGGLVAFFLDMGDRLFDVSWWKRLGLGLVGALLLAAALVWLVKSAVLPDVAKLAKGLKK